MSLITEKQREKLKNKSKQELAKVIEEENPEVDSMSAFRIAQIATSALSKEYFWVLADLNKSVEEKAEELGLSQNTIEKYRSVLLRLGAIKSYYEGKYTKKELIKVDKKFPTMEDLRVEVTPLLRKERSAGEIADELNMPKISSSQAKGIYGVNYTAYNKLHELLRSESRRGNLKREKKNGVWHYRLGKGTSKLPEREIHKSIKELESSTKKLKRKEEKVEDYKEKIEKYKEYKKKFKKKEEELKKIKNSKEKLEGKVESLRQKLEEKEKKEQSLKQELSKKEEKIENLKKRFKLLKEVRESSYDLVEGILKYLEEESVVRGRNREERLLKYSESKKKIELKWAGKNKDISKFIEEMEEEGYNSVRSGMWGKKNLSFAPHKKNLEIILEREDWNLKGLTELYEVLEKAFDLTENYINRNLRISDRNIKESLLTKLTVEAAGAEYKKFLEKHPSKRNV